jgi:ABC-type Fe3+ transport system substrate-binding protein
MLHGNEKLQTIADKYPILISEFEKNGMGNWFKPENLKKLGSFVSLQTLLNSSKIDAKQFVPVLNNILNKSDTISSSNMLEIQKSLHFLAMLPCGLRNPFKEFLENHIADNNELYTGLNYLTEGNVNHELSYYPLLDSITSPDELPDIIIASDVNHFFHRPFIANFVKKGIFKTYCSYKPNSYFEQAGYPDPAGNFTMLTANMLVIAVDTERLNTRKMPETWKDLLTKDFENDIIMRGEDNFFCNAVMLPIYKDNGFESIVAMARNIKSGKHPAEMVKLAGSGKEEAATVYIMPYFFSQKILNDKIKIVWPKDGAIASPVFMLVKNTVTEKHKKLLNFLISKEMGAMLLDRYFPFIHPEVDTASFPGTMKWLGWDFLTNNDIGQMKESIQNVFMKHWKNGTDKPCQK